MTQLIESLGDILHDLDVVVLDQWGVLHQGSRAYTGAKKAVEKIAASDKQVVVLSNSGKRASANLERIVSFGFEASAIHKVITSGEAAWRDLADGSLALHGRRPRSLYPICAQEGDAEKWVDGAALKTVSDLDAADAMLLMGVPDGTVVDAYDEIFAEAWKRGLGLICSNPDRSSPREPGLVLSPGALAARYEQLGGTVTWYGKPHRRVFDMVAERYPNVPRNRIAMVGDSIEHDICGAADAGFATVLVRGGIHSERFLQCGDSDASVLAAIEELCVGRRDARPDFSLPRLA